MAVGTSVCVFFFLERCSRTSCPCCIIIKEKWRLHSSQQSDPLQTPLRHRLCLLKVSQQTGLTNTESSVLWDEKIGEKSKIEVKDTRCLCFAEVGQSAGAAANKAGSV